MDLLSRKIIILLFCSALAKIAPVSLILAEEGTPDSLSVFSGGRMSPLEIIRLEAGNYIAVDEFQQVIGGSVEWGESGFTVDYRYGGGSFQFEDRVPFFSYDQRPYQLIDPPLFWKDKILVPLQFFTEYIPYFFPDSFSYDPETCSLRDRRYNTFIRGMERSAKENETVIFLHSSSSPRFDVDTSIPGTFLLNLFETRCNKSFADSLRAFGYVDSIRFTESGGSTQLLFFLKPSVHRYRVTEMEVPPGIKIAFLGKNLGDVGGEGMDRDLVSGNTDPKKFLVKTVIVDPGHGGKDPGAIGNRGLREKDVNLKVALKFESLLKELTDLDVIMTRKSDTYVSLKNRAEIANDSKGDGGALFISIHCNSSKKKDLRGLEAYFLSLAKTDEERAVALRENLSIRFDKPSIDSAYVGDLPFIMGDLAQSAYLQDSSELAEMMCREFNDGSKIVSRGLRQAGFLVLKDAYMPSILLELGYISNSVEEGLLGDKGYQEELAERIYRGIAGYIDRNRRRFGG